MNVFIVCGEYYFENEIGYFKFNEFFIIVVIMNRYCIGMCYYRRM